MERKHVTSGKILKCLTQESDKFPLDFSLLLELVEMSTWSMRDQSNTQNERERPNENNLRINVFFLFVFAELYYCR